jgi:rhodanese-related sulfurtransferase
LIAAGGFFARWFNIWADNDNGEDSLSASDAYAAARSGEVVLVDIRRPSEWAETGIGEGAAPMDMRRGDFVERLTELTGGDSSRVIALICARGVRSRRMAQQLRDAGFSNVIDVPEGMLGSGAGPGWLARGLPVAGGD